MSDSVPFRYYLRVRYGECDAQKVVFNARYGEYIDLAATEFLRSLGYEDELVSGELDYQLVRQTTQWKAPARFDQVLELRVLAAALGNTSFTLRTEVRRAGEDALLAEAETVYVMVDSATLGKKPLSEDFRARLLQGAAGRWVDHAGWTGTEGVS